MTLADLLADPRRASELEPAAVPAMLAQLAALSLALSARLAAPSEAALSANGADRMLTPTEAAALANVDVTWIWRRSRRRDWSGIAVRLSRKSMRIREAPFKRWLAARATT